MSYQVLARKWRPKTFREMAGHGHVLKALVNALDHDRLHHAYLFTGTRGVGKTTIARILAKCLNCESGVSSEPCGTCGACMTIDEGRFVDLIEVDAASRTKVEDTRELLENVQYAPTRGRYKVYLIDEVHMLTGHSFNALLKTLEEPPPHVKFLLATTDPQKIPATILSRCLQFSLKNMTPERVVEHLKGILDKEMVSYEEQALWLLGRAAQGSMRDALSLTDQAIAFGSGKLIETDVRQMLGTIDQGAVFRLVQALAATDAAELLAAVAQLAEHGVDFAGVLEELLRLLHRIAIGQALPAALDNSLGDRERVLALAGQLAGEDVQLYYQMGLAGRRDLPLAPDARSGFEMVLLRMLAFRPAGVHQLPAADLPAPAAQPVAQGAQPSAASPQPPAQSPTPVTGSPQLGTGSPQLNTGSPQPTAGSPQPGTESPQPMASGPQSGSAPTPPPGGSSQAGAEATQAQPPGSAASNAPPVMETPPLPTADELPPEAVASPEAPTEAPPPKKPEAPEPRPAIEAAPAVEVAPAVAATNGHAATAAASTTSGADVAVEAAEPAAALPFAQLDARSWCEQFDYLPLPGMLGNIASHCVLDAIEGDKLVLSLDENNASLFNERHVERMQQALGEYFARPIEVALTISSVNAETPAAYRLRRQAERLAAAQQALDNDPVVQLLRREFDAEIEAGSIQPVALTRGKV